MSPEEMNRYIQFLFKQLEEIKEELQRANATIAEKASEQKRLNVLVLSLTNQLNDSLQLNREQALKIANLEASFRLSKKQRLNNR